MKRVMKTSIKLLTLSLLFFIMSGSLVLAQVKFGVRVGGGLGNFSGTFVRDIYTESGEANPVFDNESLTGEDDLPISEDRYSLVEQTQSFRLAYQGAIYFDVRLGPSVSFVPELGYSSRGTTEERSVDAEFVQTDDAGVRNTIERSVPVRTTTTSTIEFGHITSYMPFRFYLPAGVNILAGPYVGFRISQSQEDEVSIPAALSETGEDVTATITYEAEDFEAFSRDKSSERLNLYSGFDFGFVAGVGYRLPIDAVELDVSLRYERSFVPIYNSRVTERVRLESTHVQHAVTFSISYSIFEL